jgi:hypothetical protein
MHDYSNKGLTIPMNNLVIVLTWLHFFSSYTSQDTICFLTAVAEWLLNFS